MGRRSVAGVSEAMALAVAVVVSIGVAAIAIALGVQQMIPASEAQRELGYEALRRASERLTLVYWDPRGYAYIANDGRREVELVRIFVDGSPVRFSRIGEGGNEIAPGQVGLFSVPLGENLAVETASGAIHVLAKNYELPPLQPPPGPGGGGGGSGIFEIVSAKLQIVVDLEGSPSVNRIIFSTVRNNGDAQILWRLLGAEGACELSVNRPVNAGQELSWGGECSGIRAGEVYTVYVVGFHGGIEFRDEVDVRAEVVIDDD